MIILAVANSQLGALRLLLRDTVNGDCKGGADLTHAGVTESSESLG
jgi:hypothetical protein